MKQAFNKHKYRVFLILILILAAVLRLTGISYQSLWLDELHSMIECDPTISWQQVLHYLKCCDFTPPLYYIIERGIFSLFGYTELVARLSSAVVGVISVWCMYLLGKEILNERLGLITSLLTAINYYDIYYSQEVRGYIFTCVFTILSFLFLMKSIKQWKLLYVLCYILFTLGLIYSHYYGLFILVSQIIIVGIFYFKTQDKKAFLKRYAFSFLFIFLGYIPWLPVLFEMTSAKAAWIEQPPSNFAVQFFYEYFGNSDLLKPLLILLLIFCFTRIYLLRHDKESPLIPAGIMLSIWIFTVYFIPYIRSVIAVPMLYPRYTIVVLPAFITLISLGFEFIQNNYLRFSFLAIFCLLSLTDILLVKKYYSTVQKTQFRELTEYIVSNNPVAYPIINERTQWHQAYYLKKFGSKAKTFTGNKESIIDSILHKTYSFDAFWLVGAHGDPKLSEAKRKALNDSSYILVNEKDFYDAWAQLYIHVNSKNSNSRVLSYKDFPQNAFDLDKQMIVAIWDNTPVGDSVRLSPGEWELTIDSKGSPVNGVYPLVTLYVDKNKVIEYYTSDSYEKKQALFSSKKNGNSYLKFQMDNDSVSTDRKEDRNLFVKNILLRKLN